MNLDEYQKETSATNLTKDKKAVNVVHVLCGLSAEVGEVEALFQKAYRGDGKINHLDLVKEIGDVMWHLSELCNAFDISLEACLDVNVKKLKDRKKRNALRGSGDNR